MDYLLFFVTYCLLLSAPGFVLHRCLNLKYVPVIGAIALSYCLFVIGFIIANNFSVSFATFQVYLALLLLLSLVSLGIGAKRIATKRLAANNLSTEESKHWLLPILIIMFVSGVYQLLVGPFTEVPADIYAHLERYQTAFKNLGNDNLGRSLSWTQLLSQGSGVFYYYVAAVNHFFELDTRKVLELVDFTNRTLFLIVIYFFAQFVFKDTKHSRKIAYCTAAFVALHMGINVFAFVRYYTFAPTMLALVLYFYAVAVFVSHLEVRLSVKESLKHLLIMAMLCVAAAAVHVQEALFIGVMIAAISVSTLIFGRFDHSKTSSTPQAKTVYVGAISVLAMAAFLALYLYSTENFSRALNAHWKLWDFGDGPGFLPQLTILNLKNQFVQVVTLWGLFVYLIFFVRFARYRRNLFIVAGMLSPFLTFLNPFFVDTFLRHYNSTTLWRLCYLIPIHFVAADTAVDCFYALKNKSSPQFRVIQFSVILTLIILLLPIANTWNQSHFSRFPTLSKSDPSSSHENYTDLIDYLSTLEGRRLILTDPMTGYMISALTQHHSSRNKFFRDRSFKHFTFADYSKAPLSKYHDYLLVVNQRDKSLSEIGSLSNHWRKVEWIETSHYYPAQLIENLETHPQRFEKKWSSDSVSVYQIK